jgi:two-component system, sensor histidine kinase
VIVYASLAHKDDDFSVVHFSVSDSGIGMSEEDQQQIFRRFVQAHEGITRTYGGSGLGLAITAQLVELMGGEIWVRSKPGQGSAFHFSVRFKAATTTHPSSVSLDGSVADTRSHSALQNARVLVVEDNLVNQTLVTRLLVKQGCIVATAQNGQELFRRMEQDVFDVILMDINLPDMDGYTATERIRSLPDPLKAKVPIIAVTAHAMPSDRDRCLKAGMNDYMSKPFKPGSLYDAIAGLLTPRS